MSVHDMRARMYSPGLRRFLSVDPLATSFPAYTPYHYVHGDPVNYTDPTGMTAHAEGVRDMFNKAGFNGVKISGGSGIETTIVRAEEDGTYTVTGGVDDGSTDIVTESGELVGQSLTPNSFQNDSGEFVEGASIDLGNMDGQAFIDLEIVSDDPCVVTYMRNAKTGEPLDFKDNGLESAVAGGATPEQHRYRGGTLRDGTVVSARDVGNMGAGIVAGRAGIPWAATRMAFDALETRLNPGMLRTGPAQEGPTSVRAQALGYRAGAALRRVER